MAASTMSVDREATHTLRRAASRFVRRAARELASPELSAVAVHAARKDLKRARTVLRLLRPALGDRVYHRDNLVLRDSARVLNAARDAKMLVETIQFLRRSNRSLRACPGVAKLAGRLQAEQASMQRRLQERPKELERTRRALEVLHDRLGDWQVGRHGWSVLGPALKRIYGASRCALPGTRIRLSDASLHEWRKQVKYLRYALQMLKPVRSRKLARLARQAERLTDELGRAHDLAVLARKADRFANDNGVDLAPLEKIIGRRWNRLAVDSVKSGKKFFAGRPRDWERQLSRCCRRSVGRGTHGERKSRVSRSTPDPDGLC